MNVVLGLVPSDGGASEHVPDHEGAQALASLFLSGDRLAHVRTAGGLAASLEHMFGGSDARLLEAAATLHDIGYSAALAKTGFHPLDGGVYLLEQGYSPRLAALIAHHSHAHLMVPDGRLADMLRQFPFERTLLADALVYVDMHSDPTGMIIPANQRITDVQARHPERPPERSIALRASVARVLMALAAAERQPPADRELPSPVLTA